jgi:hypothetical protein
MGQIVKQVSETSTRYYWYPGDRKDWIRAGLALGAGAAILGPLVWITGNVLISVTIGVSVTAALAGTHLGRRDFRAVQGFPESAGKAGRRAAMVHGGRAARRGLLEGFCGAMAAVLIANLPPHGILADWVLPIVPTMVGAVSRQAGMLYERLARAVTPSGGPTRPDPDSERVAAVTRATAM